MKFKVQIACLKLKAINISICKFHSYLLHEYNTRSSKHKSINNTSNQILSESNLKDTN